MQDRRFYVYVHRRCDNNSIFYVGKGSGFRGFTKQGRNIYWNRLANKHGWQSEIVYKNLNTYCALSIEKALIHCLRKQIVNISEGGEGPTGYSHTEKAKAAMSLSKKGKPQPPRTDAHRASIAKVHCVPVASDRGESFPSGKAAIKFLRENGYPNASRGNLSSCINGKMNSCYGRKWRKIGEIV